MDIKRDSIEKMSAQELRKIVDDLSDKNQLLENQLNIMKKCFQVVIKFKLFLEKISHKFDTFVTEDESKQLSEFQNQLSDICQGRISTRILIDAMAKSSDTSDSLVDTINAKSSVPHSFVCPENGCQRTFINKSGLKTHHKICSVKTNELIMKSEESVNSLITKSGKSDKKQKKKSLKNKTNISCQTPLSSYGISLESEPLIGVPTNERSFDCHFEGCGFRGSSLIQFIEHKMRSHSITSLTNNTEVNGINEELIVSHMNDSNDKFGEWIDPNSDPFIKSSDNSCGQLFTENSDLLRHMEANNSSDLVFSGSEANEEQTHQKTGFLDDNRFEIIELDSKQMLGFDRLVVETVPNSESISLNSTASEQPFILSSKISAKTNANSSSHQKLYNCSENLCEMTFEVILDLIIHLRAVHKKKVKQCTYENCPHLYENVNSLWVHVKECHKNQELPLRCSHGNCSKNFLLEADLNRHISSFHAIDRHSNISGIFISDTLSSCQYVKRRKT